MIRFLLIAALTIGISGVHAQDSGNLQWGQASCFAFLETTESLVPTGFTQLAIPAPVFSDTILTIDPSTRTRTIEAQGVIGWEEPWLLFLENGNCETLWANPPSFTYEDHQDILLPVALQIVILQGEEQPFMVGYSFEQHINNSDLSQEEFEAFFLDFYKQFTTSLPLVDQLIINHLIFYDHANNRFIQLSAPILIRSGC